MIPRDHDHITLNSSDSLAEDHWVPTISAVLIVKNEALMLPACLESLAGIVDQIVVLDTGSTDGTPELARSAGAQVHRGSWPGDFATARNAALAHAVGDWVLSIDADERLVAGPRLHRLGDVLSGQRAPEVFAVWIHNLSDTMAHDHAAPRLLNRTPRMSRMRGDLTWAGSIHEHPRRCDGTLPEAAVLPEAVLSLEHLGYLGAGERAAKSLRNAQIAQGALDQLIAHPERSAWELAHTLLGLGRSRAGAGQAQEAHDAFVALRELFPASPESLWGTDALAQLLLSQGHPELVPALAEEMRARGVSGPYCDWLSAQGLALSGSGDTALALLKSLSGESDLRDAMGRRMSSAPAAEMYVLTCLAEGEVDEGLSAWHRNLENPRLRERMLGISDLVRAQCGSAADGPAPDAEIDPIHPRSVDPRGVR